MTTAWRSWAWTDPGTMRSGNEDAFVDRPEARLWAVADGAGGHQHGDVASEALRDALAGTGDLSGAELVADVRTRVATVHAALREQAEAEATASGLAVTIASTLVVFLGHEAHFACLWCGDSRAYVRRGGVLQQITRDHSLVQEMVDAGVLDAALAEQHPQANVLTRAIGAAGEPPELDKVSGLAEPGDRFLLCSDGLFKALDIATIAGLVGGDDPARSLIEAAVAAEARDNVTAIVVEPKLAGGPVQPEFAQGDAPPDDDDPTLRMRLG